MLQHKKITGSAQKVSFGNSSSGELSDDYTAKPKGNALYLFNRKVSRYCIVALHGSIIER